MKPFRTAPLLASLTVLAGSVLFADAQALPQFLGQTIEQSAIAQNTSSQNISCEASIPTGSGSTLVYQIAGTIELDETGQPLRPTAENSTLTMTVQQRSSSGQRQTLLNRTTLKNFEIIAPDANYANLPFTDSFRGLSNDGSGLYSATASRYGLYASLRPTQTIPSQLQIVHYLSAQRSVRSMPATCQAGD